MKCPYCGYIDSRVVDSRPNEDGTAIRRRRLCESCGKRFTSYEKIEDIPLTVIKKDGKREIFDRNKVFSGMFRACKKRPVSREDIDRMVFDVEKGLSSLESKEVESTLIGAFVLNQLRNVDDVAYIRFASVYKDFDDAKSFIEEIHTLDFEQGVNDMRTDRVYQIAIDGPSGAGKSTIAKLLAKELKIDYIDTGAMYRAFAYKVSAYLISKGILSRPLEDAVVLSAIAAVIDDVEIDFSNGKTILCGEDISSKIRTEEITMLASKVSANGDVREKLVGLQRKIGIAKSVVMDGRDIGTNVFVSAKYKFYLNASTAVRAKRRYDELISNGVSISYEKVLQDIEKRDYDDSHRLINPLRKAEDAVEINTDDLNIDGVIKVLLENIK